MNKFNNCLLNYVLVCLYVRLSVFLNFFSMNLIEASDLYRRCLLLLNKIFLKFGSRFLIKISETLFTWSGGKMHDAIEIANSKRNEERSSKKAILGNSGFNEGNQKEYFPLWATNITKGMVLTRNSKQLRLYFERTESLFEAGFRVRSHFPIIFYSWPWREVTLRGSLETSMSLMLSFSPWCCLSCLFPVFISIWAAPIHILSLIFF